MKRLACLVAVMAVLVAGCSNPDEDADELRRYVGTSEREPRTYTYHFASADAAYTVRATVQDELRYSMVLSTADKPVMDYVVRDDALAIRLRDPGFGARLANVLGDPIVDAALKQGKWVVDPAGAPPLIQTEVTTGTGSSGDPFHDARDMLRFIDQAMSSARRIKEWSLEDIEYRPALDPWRYPPKGGREIRYDLVRPILPTSEAQTTRGQGDIGPAQFRKTSVFIKSRRVEEVCSLVDVQGHEEFIELRKRGLGSNTFLARLLQRIRKKETSVPIQEEYVFAVVSYPKTSDVAVPADATTGKLETFETAFKSALTARILRPTGRVSTRACRRAASTAAGS